ncbi:hypothetical protein GCM10010172_62360 [Paractinoplanes ferrugineus]|uniref:PH domain-containing protein n=1 Tax=Paractinoplanes ferrugineus TaxID=113564 RepID=A0A919JB36_9ACTN|nr:hypothetical protein [Actinoplanes ferrugineus]GIE16602.1 hypothetical protein Afe05nite_84420 [Actinoplanes ferrugineus]
MKSVWRSWFWNIVLGFCTASLAGICTAIAVSKLMPPTDGAGVGVGVGFGLMAIYMWGFAIRALIAGVYIESERVVVRRIARTTKINWTEIERIETGRPTSGPSGAAGVVVPVIKWRRPTDTKTREVTVDILGGYRPGPESLSARAGRELNARLKDHRLKNPQ